MFTKSFKLPHYLRVNYVYFPIKVDSHEFFEYLWRLDLTWSFPFLSFLLLLRHNCEWNYHCWIPIASPENRLWWWTQLALLDRPRYRLHYVIWIGFVLLEEIEMNLKLPLLWPIGTLLRTPPYLLFQRPCSGQNHFWRNQCLKLPEKYLFSKKDVKIQE